MQAHQFSVRRKTEEAIHWKGLIEALVYRKEREETMPGSAIHLRKGRITTTGDTGEEPKRSFSSGKSNSKKHRGKKEMARKMEPGARLEEFRRSN